MTGMCLSDVFSPSSLQKPGNALSGSDPELSRRFKLWHAGIGKTITSNTHTLESVKVIVLGGGRYHGGYSGRLAG